jgi:AraC family transcriptional regulator
MEWSERMNAAIDYIEDNLEGEIDFKAAAKLACCSIFHFQRMFMVIMDVTPAEYARRRRLTLAARDLTSTDDKVIDIAMRYGYDAPDSFTRAFRQLHGITPHAARAPGVKLSAFPRIFFNIQLKGGNDMDYRIIEKPAFEIIGRSRKFRTVNGENFIKIPQFWQEYMATPEYKTLMDLTGGKPGEVTGGGCLGICFGGEETNWDPFSYGIGIEKTIKKSPVKFEVMPVPAASWAVFDCTLDNLQDITKRIFSEWFPSTGYEHAPAPELEIYLPGNFNDVTMKCQIWMPVVKKKKGK